MRPWPTDTNQRKKWGSGLKGERLKKTLYEVLQVSISATPDVIEAAYQRLVQQHPTDGSMDSQNQLKFIKHAYEVLCNSEKRVRYDRSIASQINTRLEMPVQVSSTQYKNDLANTFENWWKSPRIIGIVMTLVALVGLSLYTNHLLKQKKIAIANKAATIKSQEILLKAPNAPILPENESPLTNEPPVNNETTLAQDTVENQNTHSDEQVMIAVTKEHTTSNIPESKIQDRSASNASSNGGDALERLGQRVDDAIKEHDFREARRWALTKEHWDKIYAAEKSMEQPNGTSSIEWKKQIHQPEQQGQFQVIQQQEMSRQSTQTQRVMQNNQQLTYEQQQKQAQLEQLQQQIQMQSIQEQRKLQRIQQQLIEQQQQKAQQQTQQRQACLNQLQNRPANQPAAIQNAIHQAGTSAASMQGLLAENFARDAALCNSIK